MANYPRYTVDERRFSDYKEARLYAKERAYQTGRRMVVVSHPDAYTRCFELDTFEGKCAVFSNAGGKRET
jgi:hypothetical protein